MVDVMLQLEAKTGFSQGNWTCIFVASITILLMEEIYETL